MEMVITTSQYMHCLLEGLVVIPNLCGRFTSDLPT